MGVGRSFPPDLPEIESFVVEFEGQDDPWVPINWRSWRKFVQSLTIDPTMLIQCCRLWISIIVCYGTFVATFGSAVFAPGSKQASQEFGVGEEVGLLGTSLFVGHPIDIYALDCQRR
jgi:DHA1 family multidrug resistance protein-like MFS transporter